MRIYAPGAAAAYAANPVARRSAPSGFAVSEGETPRAAGNASALQTVGSIEALIALQGIEDVAERRKQAVKRGRTALDALDELKLGLLGSTLTPATLAKLRSVAAGLKQGSGDQALDAVLDEIDLRVEVEIAKMDPR